MTKKSNYVTIKKEAHYEVLEKELHSVFTDKTYKVTDHNRKWYQFWKPTHVVRNISEIKEVLVPKVKLLKKGQKVLKSRLIREIKEI